MNLSHITFDRSHKIEVGKTYQADGWSFKVESIWSDKYGDSIGYLTDEGKPGDTTPNCMYYWIKW